MYEVPETTRDGGNDHDLLIAIKTNIEAINQRLNTFVTQAEFLPVKMLAFGTVGIVGTAIICALLAIVVRQSL